jgi:predicted Zn-dependent peptidase
MTQQSNSRMSLVSTALLAGCLLSAGGSLLHAQYPTEPPPPGELRPLRFPEFRETRLDNGLQLIVVEDNRLPIVSISLNLQAGSRYDPVGLEGLADMVAELITKGTESRTAEQIAAEIEGVGGTLQATSGNDFFAVSATVLADHVGLAFDLIGDVLLHPTFPESELELARTRFLSTLRVDKSDPATLASRFFASEAYGSHPYGRSQTEASLAAVSRSDVVSFAGMRLAPQGGLLVVAGDLSAADARRLAERHLGSWRGSPPEATVPEPPAPKATEIVLVHRPGSAQSNIRVGNLALRPHDDRYYAAVVANKILGGGADARLFLKLREEKGWTYGAYSGIARRGDVGFFQASTEVRSEVTDSALTEMLHQIRRIGTEAADDSELAAAKGFLVGSFPLSIQTPQQVAGQVATVKLLELGDDYLETYRQRLDAVDAPEAMRAAQTIMRPDSAVVIVVGDGQALYDKLAAIAPVRIVDVDGGPLVPDDLAAAATALEFDHASIVARRDSFQIGFQGNEIGYQVSEVVVAADSLLYREQMSIPMMGAQQDGTVRLDPASLAPLAVDISGQIAGQPMNTKLVYDGNRVTGYTQTPQPSGTPDSSDIYATVADGAIDLNAIQLFLPALQLAEGAAFTFNAFDSSEGTARVVTLKVSGSEEVTVPAGTFAAFRIELSGTPQPAVYFVDTARPHRLLKIELVGQPLTFELVK